MFLKKYEKIALPSPSWLRQEIINGICTAPNTAYPKLLPLVATSDHAGTVKSPPKKARVN